MDSFIFKLKTDESILNFPIPAVIITEQGVADLRGKSPAERAKAIIENCAHPDYKQLLWDYLKIADKGHSCHKLSAAFALHDTFLREGDMRITDFAKYIH